MGEGVPMGQGRVLWGSYGVPMGLLWGFGGSWGGCGGLMSTTNVRKMMNCGGEGGAAMGGGPYGVPMGLLWGPMGSL